MNPPICNNHIDRSISLAVGKTTAHLHLTGDHEPPNVGTASCSLDGKVRRLLEFLFFCSCY